MAREVKQLMAAALEDQFRDVQKTGCVVLSYGKLGADQARLLRQQVRSKGARMTVVKNSLFALAMERLGAGAVKDLLEGPIAVVQGEDPVTAAKVAEELAGGTSSISVRGAYVEGSVTGPEGVGKLAKIPGRQVLLGMVAGALMAPLRRLAFGLMAKPRALVNVVDQLGKRTEAGQAAG
jgi:large subunit ribosomal protein L10